MEKGVANEPRPLRVTNCSLPHVSHENGLVATPASQTLDAHLHVFAWGGLLSGSRTAKGGLSKLVTAVHYKKSRKDRCFVFSPPFFQSSSLLFFNIDGSRASLEGLRYSRRYDAACIRSHTRTFLSSFCPPDRTKNTPEYSPISRIEVSVSRESFEGTSSISRGRRGRGRNAVVPEAFERFQFRNSALLSRTEREREIVGVIRR